MDFGDILTLLIYIAIPVFIGNRKKKKAKEATQRKRQPASTRPDRPIGPARSAKTAGGGVVGRLESMMRELERSAETGKPIGGTRPVKSEKDVPDDSEVGSETKIPVWQVADAEDSKTASEGKLETEDKPETEDYIPAAAVQSSTSLFDRDDLVKGIILSEILQPPVTKRNRYPH